MKRQRNTTKIKEQTRNTEVQINEEEIGKLPEKHNQNVENRMENMQEPINKDLEELKNKQRDNTITEIKNTVQGISSRLFGERISKLEDKMVETTSEEQNKVKRMKRTEDGLRDIWDNIKHTNIRIIGVPEEEQKKKGYNKSFEEIIVENFPNMENEIVNQAQEVQRVPYRIYPRRNTPRHTNQTNKD